MGGWFSNVPMASGFYAPRNISVSALFVMLDALQRVGTP
jgi:hypothetical protein